MNPDEAFGRPLAEPMSAPGTPSVEQLVETYRARSQARRRRRRRRVLIIGSGLLGGGALVVSLLGVVPRARDRHIAPPVEPAASPTRAALEDQARLSGPLSTPESRAPAATKVSTPPRSPTASPEGPRPSTVSVRYQPRQRLTAVHKGDMKERVFDLFGGTVTRQNGTLIRIDGMRLRAKGRSPDHPQVEVADVEVAENGRVQRYWFLFAEGTLMAWGRPDEWPVAAKRYQLEIAYR
jgi:hypothetical protein